MIGLIFESPLAEGNIASIFLEVTDHVSEIFLFKFVEFMETLSTCDINIMFCFWFWGLEGTGEDGNFSIMNLFGHLWMREVFVDEDTFYELSIFNTSSCFLLNFDELEIDIFSLEIGNI